MGVLWNKEPEKTSAGNKTVFYVLAILAIILTLKFFTDRIGEEKAKQLFKNQKTGVMIGLIRKKQVFIQFRKLSNTDTFDIYPSDNLLKHIKKGDTIYKLANSNKCIVKNKSKKLKLTCYADGIAVK